MRVLLIHRHFWPDTPAFASILRLLGEGLVEQGHEVDVVTAQPSYTGASRLGEQPRRERLGGMRVERVPLFRESRKDLRRRALNTAVFAGKAAGRVLTGRYDVVLVGSTPPLVVSTAATVAAGVRGVDSVYISNDI